MNQNNLILLVMTICFFLGTARVGSASEQTPLPDKAQDKIEFDHLEADTLIFKTPEGIPTQTQAQTQAQTPKATPPPAQQLKTNLLELKYLGTLRSPEGLPYFLVTGKACQNCLEDRTVYAFRPKENKPTAFVYPGKIFDPKSRALLVESRAFYGKCLPRKGDVYVAFQKERVDRRRSLQSSVLIAEPFEEFLHENLIERHLPQINATLRMVKRKTCFEIDGRNRLMLRKPLDLRPRINGMNEDQDGPESPESNEENETETDPPQSKKGADTSS